MNSAIEVSKLTKYYGELIAVDHVSFEVKRGEIFGFLGPNGAGKTTTVRMLTGIIKPDGGTARVMGYDIQKEPLRAKQIMGIVPEMSNAYVELSAWDNLMLIGELYGIPGKKREEKGEKLLKDFGLYERRKQLVRGFSKGMKQRLLLCMALINEPRVLFLDEPTSGLDVESARMIKSMIRDLNKDGVTVFLTTHNMEEANQLCDRVAIINRGKIVAIDSPEKLRVRSSGLQSIVVSFDKPVNDKEISRISTVSEVVKMGDKIKLYTSNPGVVVPALVDLARSRGLKIVSLNTLTPSLEDVFVKLSREPAG
jgi:ABC-2 type transport system ATP-binding protein